MDAKDFTPDTTKSLKNLAAYTALFKNDLKHMHVHVIGEKFQEMHSLLQSFYERAEQDEDFFLEQAVIANEGPANPTLALSNIDSPWKPETKDGYSYEEFLKALWKKAWKYLEILYLLDDYGRVVDNRVDEILTFWTQEIEYKLAAQMATSLQGFDPEAEYDPDEDMDEQTLGGMFQENYKGKK